MFMQRLCDISIKRCTTHLYPKHAKTTSQVPSLSHGYDLIKRWKHEEPSLDTAKSMETDFKSMDNQSLVVLAHLESPPLTQARAEVLIRHIMR